MNSLVTRNDLLLIASKKLNCAPEQVKVKFVSKIVFPDEVVGEYTNLPSYQNSNVVYFACSLFYNNTNLELNQGVLFSFENGFILLKSPSTSFFNTDLDFFFKIFTNSSGEPVSLSYFEFSSHLM